jgi:hypothetical protein
MHERLLCRGAAATLRRFVFSKSFSLKKQESVGCSHDSDAATVMLEKAKRSQAVWSPTQLSALSSSLVRLTDDQCQVSCTICKPITWID